MNIYELTVFLKGFIFTLIGLDPSIPDHESIGTTEDMDHHSTDDEGTITEEHINPTVRLMYSKYLPNDQKQTGLSC